MGIKLLNKNEIAKALASDRSNEIAEGLKISRRVDSLRELMAEEELTLTKFRDESLAAIMIQIGELNEKKEELQGHLKTLEDQAKHELSKTDKQRLENLKKSLNDREQQMTEKFQELDLKEIDIALSLKESRDSVERARTHEEIAKNLHIQAEHTQSETSRTLSNARTIEENTLRLKEESERTLALREKGILTKIDELARQNEENLRVSRELAVEKIQVADQRKTLERALQRLRDNRLA